MTIPEVELLERAREYDAQALAEIYDRYADSIYRYLYRYLGDAAQAEDLTGEVFVRLLEVLGTRRAPRDRLQGWLYRVAHNLAMDLFRRQGRAEILPLKEELIVTDEQPSRAVEKQQRQQQLRVAIQKLTADQQRVVLLRFSEGLKISEVSQLLGKSEGAVKMMQYRAIKSLRRLLARGENEV